MLHISLNMEHTLSLHSTNLSVISYAGEIRSMQAILLANATSSCMIFTKFMLKECMYACIYMQNLQSCHMNLSVMELCYTAATELHMHVIFIG